MATLRRLAEEHADRGAPAERARASAALPEPAREPAAAGLTVDQVARCLHEGLAVFDRVGRVVQCNDMFRALMGEDLDVLDVRDESGTLLDHGALPWRRALADGVEVRGAVIGVGSNLLAGGRVGCWLRLNVALATLDRQTVAVATVVDVTGEREATEALDAARNRFRLAAEHAPIGIAIVSPAGVFLETNDALTSLLGYERGELTGRTFHAVTHPDDLPTDVARLQAMLAGEGETYRVVKRYLHKSGRTLRAQLTVALARDSRGEPASFISMIEDVSAQQEAHEALQHQATHDALTGLPNRPVLLERTTEALRAAAHGRPAALLFCDLDQFKLLNDSRGHDAGDAVLIEAAGRLSGCLRQGDTAARLGGDEFVVLCEALPSRQHAEKIAQRLIDEMARPMETASGVTMTMSIGIALSDPGLTAADMLRNADAALYRAKEAGRDRFALFTPELIERAAARLTLEHEVREAIRTRALFLDYQPVRRLDDGRITAYESLLRWHHPVRGLLSPAEFLPLAEATDVILDIDRYVLRASCHAAAAWGSGPDAPAVSVNISSRHVGRGLLPGLVAHALRTSGLEPGRLVLELTETALLGMTPTAQSELDTLVSLGTGIAIDDFGTGYSSLRHLVDVPASYVKIDRSFVAAMGSSRASVAVVEAVVSLCRALGIHVVAEGIEDQDQHDVLAELGCGYGQGFLLGRPGRIEADRVTSPRTFPSAGPVPSPSRRSR